MEMKEAERVIVAKPVASRPSCSNFRSFSELLSGAINVSANVSSENTVAAIRPKSVRFKSMMNPNRAPPASVSNSQADNPSDKVSKSDSKPTIYKPQARLVSKATVSLLANMGNFNVSHQQQTPTSVEAGVEVSNRERRSFTTQATSNFQSQLQPDETAQNHQVEGSAASGGDRPSYDGYNWRKYGQKQVKGSEYPRSYYKCTHPNCPVKKKVERSLDGQIAEIVYKGEHNHSKPQPAPKRNSSSGTGGGGQDAGAPLWSSNQVVNERNEGCEGRVENENENAAVGTGSMNNAGGVISDNSCGVSGECEEASKAVMEGDHEDQEPKTKRRKSENQSNEAAAGLSGEAAAAQGSQADTDQNAVGDGFRWRKYGQKVVKGNSYPRSYYRCTGPKCNVRKYVERVSDDPAGAFITTYEGKHNHDMPLRPTISQPASNPRTPTTTKP